MPTLAGEVFVPAKLAEQLSSTEALGMEMESQTPRSRAEPRAAASLPDMAISAMGKGSAN